jgi:tetratricopeptide (TPR) repeat protein
VDDDWFRSPTWQPNDQAEFERRLARARPANRPQYLRIKALALRDAGNVDAARDLFARVASETAAPASEVAFAHEALGDLHRAAGGLRQAGAEYRLALEVAPTLSGTSGEVQLSLGEVLLETDAAGGAAEVAALLDAAREHVRFNSTAFRWNVLRARLAQTLGDREAQRIAATAALDLVGAQPQFSRHPTVGLVEASAETLALLQRLTNA